MDIEMVSSFAWIGWLVLIALFLVIEMFTLEFTFLMLASGSVVGLLASILGAPVWLALILAAVAAVLLIFLLKPPLLRKLRSGGDNAPSNVERLLGMHGVVVLTTTPVDGQVKLSNGDTWTARCAAYTLPPNTPVTVTAIDGAIAHVLPLQAH